jgi:hypothetical protein
MVRIETGFSVQIVLWDRVVRPEMVTTSEWAGAVRVY